MTHYLGPTTPEGAHFVLVAEGGVGVLEQAVPADAVIALWQLLADTAHNDQREGPDAEEFARLVGEVLSVIDPQPSGVIVRFSDASGTVQVLTHGSGKAHCFTAEGDIEVGDEESADPLAAIWRSPEWKLASVDAVGGLSLDLGDVDPDGVVLPLSGGIARGQALQWGLPARQARHAAPPTTTLATEEQELPPGVVTSPPVDDFWREEQTVVMAGKAKPEPEQGLDPEPEQEPEFAPEPAPEPQPEPSAPPIDLDDRTVMMAPRRRGAGVRLPDGALDELSVTLVVGRRPQLPVYIDTPDQHRLVTVPSPTREVSGTHLEVAKDGETVVARDLGSTNGTIVIRPGHRTFLLRNGDSVALPLGSSADLGDGNIIEVVDLASQ